MRTQKTKTNKKANILLSLFKTTDRLSVADIMKALSCNRPSVYNYLNRLVEEGYRFLKTSEKHTIYYSLKKVPSDMEETLPYFPITLDVLRKYCIIQELQEAPVPKNELRKRFTVYTPNEVKDGEGRVLLDLQLTKYYDLINSLLESGEIVLNANSEYCLTGKSIPLTFSIKEEDLWKLSYDLDNLAPGTPYYKQLHSIFQKTKLLYGEIDTDTIYHDNYLIFGRKMEHFNSIHSYLAPIESFDYRHKLLKIKYQTQKKKIYDILFAVGMIVYSVEKDKLYLIGKHFSETQTELNDLIINAASILETQVTKFPNTYYGLNDYHTIFNDMFSISVESPEHVIVEFERVANVERKIRYLSAQRINATVQIQHDKIIYEDTVRGLSDFANYLRQFGSSARVIEPICLQEKMMDSINRSLKRYEVD